MKERIPNDRGRNEKKRNINPTSSVNVSDLLFRKVTLVGQDYRKFGNDFKITKKKNKWMNIIFFFMFLCLFCQYSYNENM